MLSLQMEISKAHPAGRGPKIVQQREEGGQIDVGRPWGAGSGGGVRERRNEIIDVGLRGEDAERAEDFGNARERHAARELVRAHRGGASGALRAELAEHEKPAGAQGTRLACIRKCTFPSSAGSLCSQRRSGGAATGT